MQRITSFFLDLVFPKTCLGCGKEGTFLCSSCFSRIEINWDKNCFFCNQPPARGQVCADCSKLLNLDGLYVVSSYDENQLIQEVIKTFKYRGVKELDHALGWLSAWFFKPILKKEHLNFANSLLVSTPLHSKQLGARGFNQTELLAKKLSYFLNIPYARPLIRERNTFSQTKLSGEERNENMKNAFRLINPSLIYNKKIILIDDVITTGATLGEAALTLRQGFPKQIFALALAKG